MDILVGLGLLKAFTKLSAGRCKSQKCLEGKVAVITGGARGTGFETAKCLASRGCRVIVADVSNCGEIINESSKLNNSLMVLGPKLDLSSLQSVRDFASVINMNEKRLDILVHNASSRGIANAGTFTEDKLCKLMQINYFGPFLLTHLLIDLMRKTKKSRIIFISSILAFINTLNLNSLNKPVSLGNEKLNIFFEFTHSKLCLIACCEEFARRLDSAEVSTYAIHPGFIPMSEHEHVTARLLNLDMQNYKHELFISKILNFYGKTAREGAQTTLHCAISDQAAGESGHFYMDCMRIAKPLIARRENFRTKLWGLSEELVGLKPEERLPPKASPKIASK